MTDHTAPVVLLFGGNDPVGGAGLAADIETLTAQGCYAAPVVTALTVQNTTGVTRVEAVATELVEQQARAVLNDLPVTAIKTGLLAAPETVELVAKLSGEYDLPLIVDPVTTSGSGHALAVESLTNTYIESLLPKTLLLTPNTLEARDLADPDISNHSDDADAWAKSILSTGCQWVLITGTHEDLPDIRHRLYSQNGLVKTVRQPRLAGDYHGSGCTLASACAAGVAHGLDMETVVINGLAYTQGSLESALHLGKGQWLPNRFP